ncbi:hypothetical protein [Candidatus Nitrosocosmicus franklandus]|uniref:Uncharacterized protein n=1 Tax=Candidatus Nitrosocosmicus franklandianus TaxID=1798806 RepID=A0A484IAY8_9ARCH|nr:hypothetical protein [Candidatus Nitrosocosmicus franklandus]VFJ13945.1 protein of unknown function [Candidatus Nitrosocosmicus franklandus]
MGGIIDKIKDKVMGIKNTVVDTTKDVADNTKDTVDSSYTTNTSNNYSSSTSSTTTAVTDGVDRKYEEGEHGTDVNRDDDPLTAYRENEHMTPSKINEHEPTAVKRDPSDQTITSGSQTGTNTSEAQEEYRKRGMTKVNSHDDHLHAGSSCSCGGH